MAWLSAHDHIHNAHAYYGTSIPIDLGPIHTKNARLFRRVLSVPEHSHLKQKNAGRRMNTSAVIGLDVITC